MLLMSRTNGHRFVVSSFLFLLLLCILASVNELRFPGVSNFGRYPPRNSSLPDPLDRSSNLRILIGILTLPDQYLRRHFLRLVYGTQPLPVGAQVDVKFVFCKLTKEDQKVLVALEIMRFDDIIILNCSENMNKGKTYTFFSSLPEMLDNPAGPNPPYDYVMKADDDAYVRVEKLVESLVRLPREDLYYGYVIPCPSMDPFVSYMSGMGYLISWDIVEWIRESEVARRNVEGPEDKVVGEWMREGERGKNRFNAKWGMYNYPEPVTQCTHPLWPNTIAVHLLKNQEKWIRTLLYFNATHPLKPSKLYHIP